MTEYRPARIMMIEDNEVDLLRARQALQAARFLNDITDFEYAESALEYLNDESKDLPDLILLDLNLPGMSGREFLAIMKASSRARHVPVVALTTSEADNDILASWELGVAGYIVKPVSLSRLSEIMDQFVGLYFEMVVLPSRFQIAQRSA